MATRVLNTVKENNHLIGFRIITSLKDRRGIHVLSLSEASAYYKTVEKFENVKYVGKGQWEGLECGLNKFPVQNKAGFWVSCDEEYFILGRMYNPDDLDTLVSYKVMNLNGDVNYITPDAALVLGDKKGFINAKIVPKDGTFLISSIRGSFPAYKLKDSKVKGVSSMDSSEKAKRFLKLSQLFGLRQEGKVKDVAIAKEVGATSSSEMSLKIHNYLDEPLTVSDSEILKKLLGIYKLSKENKVSDKPISSEVVSTAPKTSSGAVVASNSSVSKSENPDILRMRELVKELKLASIAYYSDDNEIMSNYDYDAKSDELEELEKKTGVVLPDSILHVVAFDVQSKLKKVKHPSKMLSLDKTKDRVALGTSLGGQPGFLGWKLDGLTVVCAYENGELVSAVTRGDGVTGEDVLHNVKVSNGVPLKISYKDKLTVRCEAMISYKQFEEINSKITVLEDKYKNPRNLASGSIRQLDSKIAAKRGIHLVAFTVVEGFDELDTYTSKLEKIRSLGFDVVPYVKVTKDTTVSAIEHFEKLIKSYEYPTDGLVISIDNIDYGDALGTTSKFPRNAKAFKWKDEAVESNLLYIDWSVGRTGAITPVAVFEPIDIEGSTVRRASLHNISVVRQILGKPYKGQKIWVIKSNMIIPQIVKSVKSE